MSSGSFDTHLAVLLAQYEFLGMIGLGKLADPATGKTRPDLAKTRAAIDMLQMLEAKTRGNLSEAEERELRRVLTTLRLNFVDEADRGVAPDAGAGERGEPKGEANQEDLGAQPD